jgi:putative ABC transport system permease protein
VLARMLKGQLAQQPLLTGMHIALVALGTAAMILVSHLLSAVSENAQRDARDIDLVVGAKGSPVQLVLAGVYHADVPSGNVRLASVMALKNNPLVSSVIPLSLGDSFAGARIVGTVPDFIAHYGGQFASGGPWVAPMDAVLGAEVAARTGLQVGETFVGAHGLDSAGGVGGGHDAHPMMVVGILKRTGATLDRLVVTSLESVWDAHGIQGGADTNETTLALVRYASPLAAATLPRRINASSDLQAASPALESARLLTMAGSVIFCADLRGSFWPSRACLFSSRFHNCSPIAAMMSRLCARLARAG